MGPALADSAENCGESATTVTPQMASTISKKMGEADCINGNNKHINPELASAMLATLFTAPFFTKKSPGNTADIDLDAMIQTLIAHLH